MKRVHPVRLIGNNRGFTLVEILMSTAIMSVVFYMLSGSMANLTASMKKTDYNANINSIRSTFAAMIVDRRAWNYTISLNPTSGFGCLQATSNANSSRCVPSPLPPPPPADIGLRFSPRTSNGGLYSTGLVYDPVNNAAHGFTLDGRVCYTYRATPAAPDPLGCFIRVDFSWRPICNGASCYRPEVEVAMNFKFNFPNNQALTQLAVNGFNSRIRIPGQSLPFRLTSNAARRCPNGSVVVAINPTTGALDCESGTFRIYNSGSPNSCYWNLSSQPTANCNPGSS